MKFHVDLSDGGAPIQQRELVSDPTARTLPSAPGPAQGSPITFPTLTRTG